MRVGDGDGEIKTHPHPSPLLSLDMSRLIINYELHGWINNVSNLNPTMSCM